MDDKVVSAFSKRSYSPLRPSYLRDPSPIDRTPSSSSSLQRYWSDGSLNSAQGTISASSRSHFTPSEETSKRKWTSELTAYGESSTAPSNKRLTLDSRNYLPTNRHERYHPGPRNSTITSSSRMPYGRSEWAEEVETRDTDRRHVYTDRRERELPGKLRYGSPTSSQNSISGESTRRMPDPPRDLRFMEDRPPSRLSLLPEPHNPSETSSRAQFPLLGEPLYDCDYIYRMADYEAEGYLRNVNHALPLLSNHMIRNNGVKPVFQAVRGTQKSTKETFWRAQVVADKRRGLRGVGDGKSKKTAVMNAALSACLKLDSLGLLERTTYKSFKPVISNEQQTILVVDQFLEDDDDILDIAEQPTSQSSRAESVVPAPDIKPLASMPPSTTLSSSGTPHHARSHSHGMHASRRSPTPPQERSPPRPPSPRLPRVESLGHVHLVDVIERELRRLQTENTQHKESLRRAETKLKRREAELEGLRQDQFEQHAKQMLEEEERMDREQELIRSLEEAVLQGHQHEELALASKAELEGVRLQNEKLEKDLQAQITETERLREERDSLLEKIEKIASEPDPAVTSLKEAFKRMEAVVDSVLSIQR